jgi:hypothetical protein
VALVVICDLVGGQIGSKKWLTTETLRTLLLGIFNLWVALVVICDLVEGQIGPKKVVDDGNLTYFIIRYRCTMVLNYISYFFGIY